MDGDPLLTGTASNFPNQNSTAAPTTWVEDLTQAAEQGIPCGTGPMLHLTQRHTGQQFLPTGELNPCADPAGVCLVATNLRTDVSPFAASEARLASGLIGGSFVGGIGTIRGVGVFGLGRGQNGVLGIGGFTTEGGLASGNGVEGRTVATAPDTAGVKGTGQVGVMGGGGPRRTGRGVQRRRAGERQPGRLREQERGGSAPRRVEQDAVRGGSA